MTAEPVAASTKATAGAHLQLFAQTGDAPVRWRLLGGNHRELGRSVHGHRDIESCRLSIKHLQDQADQLVARVRRNEQQRWVWELAAGKEPVVVCGHPFDRMIRCEQSVEMFVVSFVDAEVRGELMLTDSRRWNRALGPTCSSSVQPGVAPW